jgi:glycosyltransferase involved in cell wall biosynthesis
MITGNDALARPAADRPPPLVSAIVAVHNGGRYLEDLHQQLSDLELIDRIEVILVDDGSTDGSSDRLRRLANELPNGRYLPTGANVGVAQARNLGIGRASADYVWFIDCDDTWDRSILRRLLDRITTTDADLAMCSADLVAESGALLRRLDRVPNDETIGGAQLLDRVLTGSVNGYLWNKLFRRTLLPVDCFPRLSSQSDLAGFIGLLPRIERAELIADPLYFHVVRAGSITTSKNPDLENLLRSAAAMDRALDELGVDRTSWAARYFYTKSIRYSICNTGYRLSRQDRSTVEVQERARRGIELLDVVAVARHSLPQGLAVATLRYCGPLYQVLLRRRWQRLGRKYFAAA